MIDVYFSLFKAIRDVDKALKEMDNPKKTNSQSNNSKANAASKEKNNSHK